MKCNHCMGEEKNCIETVPIFSNLSREEMIEISMITNSRKYKKGEIIYLAGEEGKTLYVIHEGRVKISRISEAGREQIIRILGPGDFMGELSLFTRGLLTSNAEAIEATTVCIIDGGELNAIISQRPAIAVKIIQELSYRLKGAENLIESLVLYDVEERLADILLKMADNQGRIVLEMSKKDLASHIGMSQATLSRKLTFFQEEGWIKQIGHREIRILNRESLVGIAKFEEE